MAGGGRWGSARVSEFFSHRIQILFIFFGRLGRWGWGGWGGVGVGE